MKRLMLTAAAVAVLTTTAQAQMLQPVPMTAEQTEFYNFAVVATYATNCDPDKGDYLMGQAINSRLNQYGMGYMRLIEASAARAKAFADGMGMEKFCAAGASDADIQQGVAYLQDIVKIMKASKARASQQNSLKDAPSR
jgi:opacity protein-like surface antigen